MNAYLRLKEKHQKEINDFPMAFAFSNEQLTEAMEKLEVTEIKELISIGAGGLIKKSDKYKLLEIYSQQKAESKTAIDADKTGEGYIKDMFEYELANHEYNYTMDASDTLDALGLTREDVLSNDILRNGFRLGGGSYI